MSKLRGNPKEHKCECGELATYRCNACREYFCDDCFTDHLEMTVVMENDKVADQQNNRHGAYGNII